MDIKEMDAEIGDFSGIVGADEEKDIFRIYEVGYHVVPSVSEDELAQEVENFSKALGKESVVLVGERPPALVSLAYSLEKNIDGAKRSFDTAYFGWFAFEANARSIERVDSIFKNHARVLRHLIIKTNRDTVSSVLADPSLDAVPINQEPVSDGAAAEGGSEVVVESVGADPEGAEAEKA